MKKEDIYLVAITVVSLVALGILLSSPSEAMQQALRDFAFLPRF